MDGNAIILASGMLDDDHAKTAHGLIRGTERYNIVGVIDQKFAGQDAGVVTDGNKRDIPVYASVADFQNGNNQLAQYCIIGVATQGGIIPPQLKEDVKSAIKAGMSIINGLHQYLSDTPEIVKLAEENGVDLLDIRKPRPAKELSFWTGEIYQVESPIVAILGTDCALGKRTTARFMRDIMRGHGYKAEMIYTGQTGWLQGGTYGFIFDSTLNDFISGEIEKAIVECYRDLGPEVLFIEGQSALLNPTGPCGSEFIISGNAKGVILQHAPARKYYCGWEKQRLEIPSLQKNIEMIEAYGAKVLAISLNTNGCSTEEARAYQEKYKKELNIPVVLPLEDGVESMVPKIEEYIKDYHS
ncbi:DUF1611 domain-containing protein [Fulvivirgaceae bacterium BMA10]|uniref:DUF1611 domain-containing protein n=1 Tax=Splendidivirga corallicola TaxID=3051826 RepID=A0ABT8KR96_9BACT|nr:DUF1611 domain-containing protein [Fulvivirgaceae bacterium BMA10]